MPIARVRAKAYFRQLPRISGSAATALLAIAFTFMLMGWAAAFTTPGIEFIAIGTAIAAVTAVLSRRLPVVGAAVALVLLTWFLPFVIGGIYQLVRWLGA
jgi:hypothetical protein